MPIPSRRRTVGFRLTEEEYALLGAVSRKERRKIAALVYVLVIEGLQRYGRQRLEIDNASRRQES